MATIHEASKAWFRRLKEPQIIELLRDAESAASRKEGYYFLMARLIKEGVPVCEVASSLIPPLETAPTAEDLRKIAKRILKTAHAMEMAEKAAAMKDGESAIVDKAGERVVRSFHAAVRLRCKELNLKGTCLQQLRQLKQLRALTAEHVRKQYRERYPNIKVPQTRSLSRTIRRKELWNFERGRPPKQKADKSG
jgi:hypothetical protein